MFRQLLLIPGSYRVSEKARRRRHGIEHITLVRAVRLSWVSLGLFTSTCLRSEVIGESKGKFSGHRFESKWMPFTERRPRSVKKSIFPTFLSNISLNGANDTRGLLRESNAQ